MHFKLLLQCSEGNSQELVIRLGTVPRMFACVNTPIRAVEFRGFVLTPGTSMWADKPDLLIQLSSPYCSHSVMASRLNLSDSNARQKTLDPNKSTRTESD